MMFRSMSSRRCGRLLRNFAKLSCRRTLAANEAKKGNLRLIMVEPYIPYSPYFCFPKIRCMCVELI